MTSLPFIVCWRKHIFSIIIQIFTEKHFSSKFWTAGSWTWLTLHFLAFWEIYILITHWWPISIPKTSNGVEWCHMTYFSWNHTKIGQIHNIWKQNNSFPKRGYSYKSDKWFKNWSHSNVGKLGDEKVDVSKKFQPYLIDTPRHRNFAKFLELYKTKF